MRIFQSALASVALGFGVFSVLGAHPGASFAFGAFAFSLLVKLDSIDDAVRSK